MTRPEDGLKTQLWNIERAYGHSIPELIDAVRKSGLFKHQDVVAMLKDRYGMSHGNAHRIALVARDALFSPGPDQAAPAGGEVKAPYERLLATVREFGADVEVAPKKGYVSLRRRKQFAMLQPGAKWVNVGLILRDVQAGSERLETAGSWNALFTHRVRVRSASEMDDELVAWLRAAYAGAG